MSKPNVRRSGISDHLSVSHKASLITSYNATHLDDALIQTDLEFNVTGWNASAERIHGQPGAMGKNLFQLVDIDFIGSDREELRRHLDAQGYWTGEVSFHRFDGKQLYFRTTATHIIDAEERPMAIMIVSHNISDVRVKEKELEEAEKKYEKLLNTLPQGVMMINAEGRIDAVNKKGAEIFGLTEDQLIGAELTGADWKTIRPDGSPFPPTEFPAVVSLQTGFPQRNVVIGVKRTGDALIWVSINSEALIHPGKFEPYAAVVSFTDITDSKRTEEELRKINERFYHVAKVTSDAIWDIDIAANQIYRSGAFRELSGYQPDQIDANLDWWFSKVHPEDRERVKAKLDLHIEKGYERWDDEYRFECADGSYKYLCDSGIILYRMGKPVRMMGAIKDLTAQKELERQLLDEQVQHHKDITKATIQAQEQEKANISRELHDNVNQILMSAKLFMDTAKRIPQQSNELLDKAIEYQLLALQEIRKISRSLSTTTMKTMGIRESVDEIVNNMKLLQQLEVDFIFNERVEQRLSDDQKLMLFRIIQEQTNNIIKYAHAKSVKIMINENGNMIRLVVSDDGVGFDMSQTTKGIGFLNIVSRADVYNGKVNIISSPGSGCTMEVCFPVN